MEAYTVVGRLMRIDGANLTINPRRDDPIVLPHANPDELTPEWAANYVGEEVRCTVADGSIIKVAFLE